jgi:DNA-binding NarL/FixJ family response regulator
MPPISVLLVDDHVLFREGVASLLRGSREVELVGEAGDGAEAVAKARELMPDLILMDIRMPGVDGLAATRQIKQELPYVKIIILTVSEDECDLFEAIKSGAEGYLLKNISAKDLLRMIKGIFAGEAPISGTMASKMLAEFARHASSPNPSRERGREGVGAASPEGLTEREQEILRLVAEGATNREIGRRLGISENTVKKHLRNILDKLHLQNRVQAAIYALRESLLTQVHLE